MNNKDYLGNDVHVGDLVTFINSHYKQLEMGIVHKLHETRCTIKTSDSNWGNNIKEYSRIVVLPAKYKLYYKLRLRPDRKGGWE